LAPAQQEDGETSVVLSIHPKWAELIYSGKKTAELRKSFPKDFDPELDRVYLYETAPVKKVTGFFLLEHGHDEEELQCSDELFDDVSKKSCVPRKQIDEYFKSGNGKLEIWRIRTAVKFDAPFELHEKRAPQSWMYASVGYMEDGK